MLATLLPPQKGPRPLGPGLLQRTSTAHHGGVVGVGGGMQGCMACEDPCGLCPLKRWPQILSSSDLCRGECRRGVGRSWLWPDTGRMLSRLRASGTHGAGVQADLEESAWGEFNKAS